MSSPLPACLECGTFAYITSGREVYPHRLDLFNKPFWVCPECDARCGCHPGTTVALGRPAGPATRRARSAAHEAFDPLWREKTYDNPRGRVSRGRAYQWLGRQLGIAQPHIGEMTAEQCEQVVEKVKHLLDNQYQGL